MSKFDNTISKTAQKFRLNMELEPQLVSGAFKSADSQMIGKITNKLDDFIKASKSHIDDVVGKGGKFNFNGKNEFTWKLRGKDVTLKDVSVISVDYIKRNRKELVKLRNEFNTSVRKDFLQKLAVDTEKLRSLGFSETDIKKMLNGKVPTGYQVHHKLPLDDSGTNAMSNLVLIKNDPYHKVITNYQRSVSKTLNIGEMKNVKWPVINGSIYPN